MADGPTIILTHGDLDGMVSAILFLRRLPPDCAIRITNGDHLPRELETLKCLAQRPRAVYIADLPLVAATAERVRAAVAALAAGGCAVHVFDHHLGWDGPDGKSIEASCSAFHVQVEKTTAAAIVWARFLEAEPASRRWLQVLAQRDRSVQEDIRRDFGILAALMQRQHWPLQDQALRDMAAGLGPSETVRRLADWYYHEHRPREREIAGLATVLATPSGRRIAWLDLRAQAGRVMVARDVIERFASDLVASVTGKGIVVGGASIDQGVDLTGLHGQHDVDGVALSVGGHRSPVLISPVEGGVDDRFVEAARKFLLRRL